METGRMASSQLLLKQKNANYVLIIEDSQDDFEMISRTFKRVEFFPDIHHCTDGNEAMEFLLYASLSQSLNALPSLILLDLNLPGMDGREILLKIKSNKALKRIPVIILSTSHNQDDIEFSLRQGAEKYLCKPISAADFAVAVKVIKKVWESQIIAHGPFV